MAHRHEMHFPRPREWKRNQSSAPRSEIKAPISEPTPLVSEPNDHTTVVRAATGALVIASIGMILRFGDGQVSPADATAEAYSAPATHTSEVTRVEPVRLPTAGPVEVPFAGTPSGDIFIGPKMPVLRRAS